MLILGIDTSGKTASVAISENNIIQGQITVNTNLTHSQVIMPLCKNLLENCGKTLNDVEKIVVSAGPGSYTGLRIGISAVKAMTFSLNIECCGISTLESLAYNMLDFDGIVCPVMKARLNLVYNAIFKVENGKVTRLSEDRIIVKSELAESLKNYEKVVVNGDASEDFINEYGNEKIKKASPLLLTQNAGSLCIASLQHDSINPEELQALYLQPTKAEKDLNK